MTEIWQQREAVLLQAIADAEAEFEDDLQNEELEERTGLPDDEVQWGLKALLEADPSYIVGINATSGDEFCTLLGIRLAERGRREVGQWPNDNVGAALVALLDDRIASEPDERERGRFERLRDGVRSVGIDVLTQLIVAASRQATGL